MDSILDRDVVQFIGHSLSAGITNECGFENGSNARGKQEKWDQRWQDFWPLVLDEIAIECTSYGTDYKGQVKISLCGIVGAEWREHRVDEIVGYDRAILSGLGRIAPVKPTRNPLPTRAQIWAQYGWTCGQTKKLNLKEKKKKNARFFCSFNFRGFLRI